jgi:DNA-binding HxlR family transcriptional regulator
MYMSKSSSVAKVMRAISDGMALDLYKTIASSNGATGEFLQAKIKISRKQYYSRLSNMAKAGLIKRKHGRYSLTAFGRVVYDSERSIENAYNIFWKLKAIDSIGVSNELPREEYSKIVEALIDNYEIKDILVESDRTNEKARSLKSKGEIHYQNAAKVEKVS